MLIDCILFKAKRFERKLENLAEKEFKDFNFHYTYYYVITVLYKTDNVKVNDIAFELGLDQSTVSRMIIKLEEQGLVQKGTPRAKKEIILTEKGKELVPQMNVCWKRFHKKLNEYLTEVEVEEMKQILTEKIKKLEK